MPHEQLLQKIYTLVGGEENITSLQSADNILYIRLKDQSAADLNALNTTEGILSAELSRGKLTVNTQEHFHKEETQMADNKKIASDVLTAVGGKENVSFVTNCMTRLRFTLNDNSIPDKDAIKKIDGVLGCQDVGGQLQVIIGQNVSKVYLELCNIGGFTVQKAIDENLDAPKEKLTFKKIWGNILNYLSASMVAILPAVLAGGLIRAVSSILGPEMLGVISADSDMYLFLDFIYDAAFYFIPIYVGYSAAKKLDINPIYGMFLGGILIAPDFMEIVSEGIVFAPLGINMITNDYSQTILPILISVWVMSYVEKFFRKHLPDAVTAIFTPFFTILIMAPVSLYFLAPIGTVLGSGIAAFITLLCNYTGFIGYAVLAAAWPFLVITGMHVTLGFTMSMNIMTLEYGDIIGVLYLANFGCAGMALGAVIAAKNKSDRSSFLGSFISCLIGGVAEPALYGIGLKYVRPFVGLIIGLALSGAYLGITQTFVYVFPSMNFLGFLAFSGATSANFINGIIACLIALFGTAAAVALIGLEPRGKKAKKQV